MQQVPFLWNRVSSGGGSIVLTGVAHFNLCNSFCTTCGIWIMGSRMAVEQILSQVLHQLSRWEQFSGTTNLQKGHSPCLLFRCSCLATSPTRCGLAWASVTFHMPTFLSVSLSCVPCQRATSCHRYSYSLHLPMLSVRRSLSLHHVLSRCVYTVQSE